jgi:cytochrome c biogenesis protein CcmG, thiol:disulfide interchange protein DsbE
MRAPTLARIAAGAALVAAVVAGTVALTSGGDDAGAPPAASSSPAIVLDAAGDVLPDTVAALPPADGAAFRRLLEDLHGTPVVVNLWASWCEPCEREMPMLSSAARRHRSVQFVGVDSLDARASAESFIDDYDVPFPSLFDPDGSIRTELGSLGLPVTVFYDAEGTRVAQIDGELTREALDEHLAEIEA